MSQLLRRLQQEYAALSDPIAKAEVAAQIAAILARHGSFLEARQVIGHIQQGFGKGESGQVTVMKMIAEGLVLHYQSLSPDASVRLLGALSIARMAGYQQGIALAAAWKAHVEFEQSEFTKMAESLRTAVSHAKEDQHEAWVRISAVMSNSYLICGLSDQGHAWFKRGHEHASKLGDTESIDALLYNRAAFSVACLRVAACTEQLSPELISRVRGEVNSASNLQKLAGVVALSAHVELLNARLMILECRFDDAISALEAVRVKEPFAAHNFRQSLVDLEIAYCQSMSGAGGVFHEQDWTALAEELSGLDVDDRLVALWMMIATHRKTTSAQDCDGIEARFASARREYEADRFELQQLLASVTVG